MQVSHARLSLVAMLASALLSTPLLVIIGLSFFGASDVWAHLFNTVLGDYVRNSISLMFGVGLGVLLIGISTAWLTSRCEFPGRRLLSFLLLLPLAMPAYIIAYTYTGLLDFAGPVQSMIRDLTGLGYGQYWFPQIRSLGGAMAMLVLVLYPYVYLITRAAFLAQSDHLFEVARSLGVPRWQAFFKVSLPMARPAIVAGLSLALMETLADYGTVQYFGVPTFTTGIFRTFYGFGDSFAAAQLATVLLLFVFMLIMLENYSRRRVSYSSEKKSAQNQRIVLSNAHGWLSTLVCSVPPLLGFLIPSAVLLKWAFESDEGRSLAFIQLAWNSFELAALAAFISLVFALTMAYAVRLEKLKFAQFAVKITSLGYALPGTIIAVGVIISFAWLDHNILPVFERLFNLNLGLLFSGTIFTLLFAYTVRFLAVSLGSVSSGLVAIKPSIDDSARTLGRKPLQVLTSVHVPLLRGTVLTAFLIVFVDVLKELPATLILRPFNFNTLAVRAYELASDERLIDAAPASLMIVVVGLIPVFLLNRTIMRA